MKKREKEDPAMNFTTEELLKKFHSKNRVARFILLGLIALGIVIPASYFAISMHGISNIDDGNTIALVSMPIAATSGKKETISIPAGTVKANPFLPYRDISGKLPVVQDVPQYVLLEPPEIVGDSSDAARIMDTVVSGILYDKYSPSAILNIEGNDYLVKKGDVVNNYKVINIMQDSVTVKLGTNTYKAGIGEILTEGTVNHNEVSNLSNKFGGERR